MSKQKLKPYIARQGDVILIDPTLVPGGDTELAPKDKRGVVLAEGETSGHHHAVLGKNVKLMRFRGVRADRLLEIGEGGAEVRVIGGGAGGVDRHTPIALVPGTTVTRPDGAPTCVPSKLIVRVQRAWDSTRARQVQD